MSQRGTGHTFWSTSTLVEQTSREQSASSGATGSTRESNDIAKTASNADSRKPRLDFTNVVEIHVGEEGCFFVPENRLVQRSKFFRDRCRRAEISGEEVLTLDLAKEDRFLFDMYLQVLYQDQVILPLHVVEASDPQWCVKVMLQTYILAEKVQDTSSCNIVVDSLIDFCVIATDPDVLKAQLCRMPAEMALGCVERFAYLRHEMLVDVRRGKRPDTITSLAELDRCKYYHQHNVDGCPTCPALLRVEAKTEIPDRRRAGAAGSSSSSEVEFYYPEQQQK